MPDDFEQMWRDLAPIGRASSTGYFRQPFESAERELDTWFVAQATDRDLRLETDGNGNRVAWWEPDLLRSVVPPGPPSSASWSDARGADAVLTGSHLDSVLDGGAYDGPLGVVSAFAAVDALRDKGFTPTRPIGICAFVEEEGSRFGLACLGSRLATGAIDPESAAALADRDGVRLDEAMSAAGLEPALGPAPWLARVGTFVELHVEQGRDLVERAAPVGLASAIWPHGRYRFDFIGEANHAGTTRMEDRRDPMLTYAMTALAANKQARLASMRATFGRVEVAPNGTNAVPSRVTGWLDVRCDTDDELARLVGEIERMGHDRAGRDGTVLSVTAESVSAAVHFDDGLTGDIKARLDGPQGTTRRTARHNSTVPVIPTQAGHDAGILAQAGIPTAMLFVRNPTGVSHSPAEHAELADCLAGVEALADVLEELAG
jgi:beta-ureidopropionase / N-carbamoyl-L-amino-acid hydrolase